MFASKVRRYPAGHAVPSRPMRTHYWLVLAASLALTAACSSPQPASQPNEPELLKTTTIKDIMDSMIDPSGDFVFESVQQISDEQGIREIAPRTDEEWQEVKRRGMILMEAPNLLVMPGRKVAQSGEKAENPEVELAPEEIQKLIDSDRPAFINRARTLQDAALQVIQATDAKDKDALFKAAEKIDEACENCHLQYWYPNDQAAQEAAAAAAGRK
jgi:hypothetical protein